MGPAPQRWTSVENVVDEDYVVAGGVDATLDSGFLSRQMGK
jgi:hypothetical protein